MKVSAAVFVAGVRSLVDYPSSLSETRGVAVYRGPALGLEVRHEFGFAHSLLLPGPMSEELQDG
jgi:hypothetical protein